MDIEEAKRFVAEHHQAVLATNRPDGSPQLTPVTAGVDTDGYVVVSSRATAYKTKNLRRDPRAVLCAFTDNFFGEWVQVEGEAEIVDLPEAMEPLVSYYRAVAGEHPDWDDYRAAMAREKRVLIKLSVTRAGPTVSG